MGKVIPKDQIDYVRQIAWHRTTEEVRTMLNEKFGTDYSYKQVKALKHNHKINSGLTGQFEKGHHPWTKGKSIKEICYKPDSYARWKSSVYTKGQRAHNKAAVGTEVIDDHGYIKVKVADPSTWEFKHRLIYEKAYGPIPKGMMLAFIDGDKTNISLDNMMLISNEANGIRRRYRKLTAIGDADIGRAVLMTSRLGARIEELDGTREKRKEDRERRRARKERNQNGQN